ncbi:MAG TPA: NAD(P)/FAD-dependent oxidoreductase [Nitrospiraceae bacterium]|nr:NAD(P)/FAD-dependent oxidoreductase [Nitrospiraceae bacterium]
MQVKRRQVVIVGGGFGGLTAAQSLRGVRADIVLIDRTNHHLFQPLLYQVATAALSAGDIASPLRTILQRQRNLRILMNDVVAVDRAKRIVRLMDTEVPFDYLILAPGSRHSYFGKEQWGAFAPGLKTLADALSIREHMLLSFEHAERVHGTPAARRYLTFVIVGAGPTGVELAGAIAEIARASILPDFPLIPSSHIRILLIEAGSRILMGFDESLAAKAQRVLMDLGVEVRLNTRVTEVNERGVFAGGQFLDTANAIWAAGNEASPLLRTLGLPLDRQGRVAVDRDLSVPGDSSIFVIGDAASASDVQGQPLPALAPVAIQQGRYVAHLIAKDIPPEARPPFIFKDRGMLATIGKAHAIAQIGRLRTVGVLAWLLWCVVHIFFLIGFRNRLRVMFEWAWYYLTSRSGARLIIGRKRDAGT